MVPELRLQAIHLVPERIGGLANFGIELEANRLVHVPARVPGDLSIPERILLARVGAIPKEPGLLRLDDLRTGIAHALRIEGMKLLRQELPLAAAVVAEDLAADAAVVLSPEYGELYAALLAMADVVVMLPPGRNQVRCEY